MQLIYNLSEDSVIRKSLCDTFHVVPCLASYLRQHLTSFSDPVVALCLQVLQKVAYGTKVRNIVCCFILLAAFHVGASSELRMWGVGGGHGGR